jgi:4-amino-4-deoxy-L-arabinose transferase-like glycosyltransferase
MTRVVAAEPRREPDNWQWLPRILVGLALLVFVSYLVIYTYYAIRLFQFPFDYDQGEGYELVDTILLSQGQWPYRDIEVYPFYSSNYPPLYHLVVAPLVLLFGPHYWTGRLVTFLGTLLTAAAIGWAVYSTENVRRRWWLAALAGLAFLASNYVYHVGPLFRQHMFMVMLETLAVVLMAKMMAREEADGRPRWLGLLLVMALLLAAGYTKQLAYATIAAVFIFLFLRRPLRAVVWATGFVVVTALIFLGINLATGGHWWTNTVTANINEFIPGQATGLMRQWLRLHLVLAVVAALYALFQLYGERLSVYSIWFAVTLVNSLTAGKWGAGESYFATTIVASCILTGIAFGRLLDKTNRNRTIHALAASIVALLFLWQAWLVFHLPTETPLLRGIATALGQPATTMVAPQTSCSAPRPPQPISYVDSAGVSLLGRPPTAADRDAGQRIAAYVAAGDRAAFSEEAGFNLYAGREVVTNPTQLLNLYKNDAVDLTEMVSMLDERAFETVILRAQFYPPPVLAAIGRNYETVELVEMNGFVYCILESRMP